MTELTKEHLKRAEEIWGGDTVTRNPELYMFDCNQSHTEHAIRLIALGLANSRKEVDRSQRSQTPEQTLERRTEYIGEHALEGEFDDIVKCMAEERRVTLEECAALVADKGDLTSAAWEIKLLRETS